MLRMEELRLKKVLDIEQANCRHLRSLRNRIKMGRKRGSPKVLYSMKRSKRAFHLGWIGAGIHVDRISPAKNRKRVSTSDAKNAKFATHRCDLDRSRFGKPGCDD